MLEEVGALCEGREGQESLDFSLEREGWSVARDGPDIRMQRRPEGSPVSGDLDRGGLLEGFAQRDSMKQAGLPQPMSREVKRKLGWREPVRSGSSF